MRFLVEAADGGRRREAKLGPRQVAQAAQALDAAVGAGVALGSFGGAQEVGILAIARWLAGLEGIGARFPGGERRRTHTLIAPQAVFTLGEGAAAILTLARPVGTGRLTKPRVAREVGGTGLDPVRIRKKSLARVTLAPVAGPHRTQLFAGELVAAAATVFDEAQLGRGTVGVKHQAAVLRPCGSLVHGAGKCTLAGTLIGVRGVAGAAEKRGAAVHGGLLRERGLVHRAHALVALAPFRGARRAQERGEDGSQGGKDDGEDAVPVTVGSPQVRKDAIARHG